MKYSCPHNFSIIAIEIIYAPPANNYKFMISKDI